MRSSRPVALAALGLAVGLGCGEVHNARFPGRPLVSIHGTLEGVSSRTAGQPIRLAVLWYGNPDTLLPKQPAAILSDEVTYAGDFPIAYTFDLFEPPPAAALQTYYAQGEQFREARGAIIAWQDDGDGRLTSIPTDGAAGDRVLGASVPDVADWSKGSYLVYRDDSGYRLVQDGQSAKPTSLVPLALTLAPDLVLFLCDQLFTDPQVPASPGTACATPPAHPALHVFGDLTRYATAESVFFQLTDGVHVLTDAEISVNGQRLAWSPSFSGYHANGKVTIAGENVFSVDAGVAGATGGVVRIPEVPVLIAPTEGQRFRSGQPVEVVWSAAVAGSFLVRVWDVSQSDFGPLVYETQTSGSSVTTAALDLAGPAAVGLMSVGDPFTAERVFVQGSAGGVVQVTFSR